MDDFLDIRKLHIRLTTNLDMDTIENFIMKISNTYLISQEDPGTHQHYHILVEYQDPDPRCNDLRYKLKKELGTSKWEYSISTVKSKATLMKYILKDNGVIRKSNIPDKVIHLMKKCSYKKAHKGKFAADLLHLEQLYIAHEYAESKFRAEVILLKISYNQNIYVSHLQAYFNKLRLKKRPSEINAFISANFE